MIPDLERYCLDGEAADALLADGKHEEARAAYTAILDRLFESGMVDQFVVSKCALGLMLAFVGLDDPQAAHAIWISPTDRDSPLWIGVAGIEEGRISAQDAVIYQMLSASRQIPPPTRAPRMAAAYGLNGGGTLGSAWLHAQKYALPPFSGPGTQP